MKSNTLTLTLLLMTMILFTSCADVAPVQECLPDDPYGFFGGLWHGMIMFFSFIGSFFNDDIAVYAVNNNGGWYDFGFFMGLGSLGSSASLVSSPNRR